MGRNGRQPVVLLTEDNGLIGLDVREALENAGYRVAGPFGKQADALFWLAQETPDLAVLDLLLRDGPTQALAERLRQMGVPFVVYSGRSLADPLARDLADVPWIDKPAPYTAVIGQINKLAVATTTL